MKTFQERLDIAGKFYEDATFKYGSQQDAEIVLAVAERNIKEYIDWIFREGEFYNYEELDDKVFEYYHSGEKTLTEDSFTN